MRTVAVHAYDGVQLLDVARAGRGVRSAARESGADDALVIASPDGRDLFRRRARARRGRRAGDRSPAGRDVYAGGVRRSEETLRRAFDREAGTTPAGYRERFRTTGV